MSNKIQNITQLQTQFAPHSDHLGIKTGGVLETAWHVLHNLFSDFNCETYHLRGILLQTFSKSVLNGHTHKHTHMQSDSLKTLVLCTGVLKIG